VSLVKLYRVAAPTSRPQHLNQLASARRFPYVGNSNVRTSDGESLRNRSPNIARPSGYQCDLSFEIHCSPQNPLLSPSASERQRSRTKINVARKNKAYQGIEVSSGAPGGGVKSSSTVLTNKELPFSSD
jgi:hypothetical protein